MGTGREEHAGTGQSQEVKPKRQLSLYFGKCQGKDTDKIPLHGFGLLDLQDL